MELKEYEEKMKNAIDYLDETYVDIRVGRANPNILNKVMVTYYGVPTPINQVAGISVPEARQILIQPWEVHILKDIERALIDANLGIAPVNDGKCIRLIFPELTEERRVEVSKEIRKKAEDTKVTIRNARREGNEDISKKGKEESFSEDDIKRLQDDMQDLTDKYIKIVDEMAEKKEKEIMEI